MEHNGIIQATNSITLKPGVSIDTGQTVNLSVGGCDANIRYTGGFEQRSMADYQYDANGNLTKDPNKKINITYNHLNLPYLVSWYEDGISKEIEWLYDASGQKLQKIVRKDGVNVLKKDYFEGIEWRNDTLEAQYHSEGRVTPKSGGGWQYEYNLTDHLGNVRVVFSDTNNDGTPEILQENAYYPFGMTIEELSHSNQPLENKYLYNGKELDTDFGLNWYHYGARMYDAVIGRFTGVDPIADKFPWVSTYNYAENEPIANIDLWGLQKYKPQTQSIDKPADLVSTKMLNNLLEGAKTVAIEFSSTIDNLSVKAEKYISSFVPGQGTPDATDYYDSGTVKGSGVEGVSNTSNANGVLNTPSAKEGATAIVELGSVLTAADGGGILGDAASKGEGATQFSRTTFYAGLLVDKIKSLQDKANEQTSESTLKTDTTYNMGNVKITKYSPSDENENQ